MISFSGSFSIKSDIDVVVVNLLRGVFINFEKKSYIFVRKLNIFFIMITKNLLYYYRYNSVLFNVICMILYYITSLSKFVTLGERITEENYFQWQKYLNVQKINSFVRQVAKQIMLFPSHEQKYLKRLPFYRFLSFFRWPYDGRGIPCNITVVNALVCDMLNLLK